MCPPRPGRTHRCGENGRTRFCVVTPAQAGVHLVRSLAEFTLSWQSQILRCAQDDTEGLCRNSTHKSFKFSIACAVILSPHFGRRTPVVYSVRQPPANCRGPSLRSPETRCVSHFDSPSLGCHSEPAFWAKNPRSLLCWPIPPRTAGVLRSAQDDSEGLTDDLAGSLFQHPLGVTIQQGIRTRRGHQITPPLKRPIAPSPKRSIAPSHDLPIPPAPVTHFPVSVIGRVRWQDEPVR